MGRTDQLLAALIEASPHVVRQLTAGKHAQDRTDAEDWLKRWASLVEWAMAQPRQPPMRWDAPFGGAGGP